MASLKIRLEPHTGQKPVRGSDGRTIAVAEVDTGMHRVYLILQDDSGETRQQIAFLHPNGFMHFIIPDPPQEFQDQVKAAVEAASKRQVTKVGSPPPIPPETPG